MGPALAGIWQGPTAVRAYLRGSNHTAMQLGRAAQGNYDGDHINLETLALQIVSMLFLVSLVPVSGAQRQFIFIRTWSLARAMLLLPQCVTHVALRLPTSLYFPYIHRRNTAFQGTNLPTHEPSGTNHIQNIARQEGGAEREESKLAPTGRPLQKLTVKTKDKGTGKELTV